MARPLFALRLYCQLIGEDSGSGQSEHFLPRVQYRHRGWCTGGHYGGTMAGCARIPTPTSETT